MIQAPSILRSDAYLVWLVFCRYAATGFGLGMGSGSPRFCSACSNGLEGDMKQHPDYDFWFLAVGFFSGVVLTLLIQAVAR